MVLGTFLKLRFPKISAGQRLIWRVIKLRKFRRGLRKFRRSTHGLGLLSRHPPMGGFEIINGLGLPPPISCIAGFRKNQWVRSSCKFALCQPTQFLVGGNIRYLLNERSTRLFNYQLYMAALCANGGERKLFGGTFGGISKDVIGKCLYISMYFYCLFCSYYLPKSTQVFKNLL